MNRYPPELCSECGKKIVGRLRANVFNDRVVCTTCWNRLDQKSKVSTVATAGTGDDEILHDLVAIASKQHLAWIEYLKPGESDSTRRFVEPYRLQDSYGNLMVQCWQVDPVIPDRAKWRNFRLDRIQRLRDSGTAFRPRCEITLCDGEVHAFEWGHDPIQTISKASRYFRTLDSALSDQFIDDRDLSVCRNAGEGLTQDEIRGAHAQIFNNALQETLADGEVSDKEAVYLAGVRKFLVTLGWAP